MSRFRARTDLLAGLLFGLFAFALLAATAQSAPVVWDEPVYMTAAEAAAGWLGLAATGRFAEAADPVAFGGGWGLVNEAAPLTRIVSGVGWAATRAWLPTPLAHRIGLLAFNALCLGAIVAIIARRRGAPAALFTGPALLAAPRLFFHAHLNTQDYPLLLVWGLATLVFVRQMTLLAERAGGPAWRAVLYRAFVIGAWAALALLTKVNAVLLAPVWGLWALLFRRSGRAWAALLLAPLFAAAVAYAGWPWLWKTPIATLRTLWDFWGDHFIIGQWWAGRLVMQTTWEMPPLIVLITTPVALLALATLGAAVGLRRGQGRDTRAWISLHLIGMAVLLAYFPLPFNDLHDQDRLLLPLWFHLAALAGEGFAWLAGRLAAWRPALGRAGAQAVLAALLLAPGVVGIVQLHPYQLAYYNALIGGPRGAAARDMETIYFASTYGGLLDALNTLPSGSKVWVIPNSYDVLYYYQFTGRLRPDLVMLRPDGWGSFYDGRGAPSAVGLLRDADAALLERRQTGMNGETEVGQEMLRWAAEAPEVARLERQGVTLATLHLRP